MPIYTNKPNIQEMFDSLADSYDKMNTILSLGMHNIWNSRFVQMLGRANHLIDLCAGTGKVVATYIKKYPGVSATLVDFSKNMLNLAKQRYPCATMNFIESDIACMPFEDNSYDLASMAYGLRNLPNPENALREIHRVLTTTGRLGILELTSPSQRHPIYLAHKMYLKAFVPWIGKVITKNHEAYAYLSNSIRCLPKDQELESIFQHSGFLTERKQKLFWGAATIWILKKFP
ncbi:ubiquinone/menaquinone biosynthesis methyltransferase family protein [Chlamydia ibidis]|uniref:Demethylmenaquinone methyltransferase n=2 Tax=Chlamydia ibidis TaxID=1405396 RepID=S7J577_9CHLA|nr:bifunctional demethylmenaquinone methyltransferase/2-methoxy-6-polyprenyl-1,4-benzoquinol methylase UbiE [Chlamydia ibidis]EPP35368.1 ubiquinone/menaquinone biosynthesis methyltransferase family protein [Chlamydia ibidis]EQM63088.1 ubiquinone/menaquinone biosynthesis methyltransferase family protein [Chlamydia ibidis 10-1398/6]